MLKPRLLPRKSASPSNCSGGIFDWDQATLRLEELNALAGEPDLWQDRERAQSVLKERTTLERAVSGVRDIENQLEEALELIELGESEGEDDVVAEAGESIRILLEVCRSRQIEALLSGEADANDCYLEIHAGAGGTEAQDWAEMLLRMYERWCRVRDYEVAYLARSDGEEAGIKSVTLLVRGHNAYGWLKTESGVHRLVRISPFDSAARRHTSFSSTWVYPVIDDTIDVQVEDKDLRIDTYRSSGAGGQHVNKTDSAIRITHEPTGIVVQCQNDRSQHRNRAMAMEMLRARLYELEVRRREEEASALEASKSDIGWGHQIRSYVLQPYQMVKDLRTGVETADTQGVLNGEIGRFLEAALSLRLGGGAEAAERTRA